MGATMKDIARQTGLGLATVSSYFNGGNVRKKNCIKIEEAIKELNFEVNEVARGLKTNRTKTVGIILPELNNIFFAEIITEAEDILRNNGYASMICDCRSDEKREEEAAEFLLHRRVDGLLIMPTGSAESTLNRFKRAGKPIVIIDRKPENSDCPCVVVDNEGAGADAVKRLIKAGHKKIGLLEGPDSIYTSVERRKGYCRALKEAGIKFDEKLVESGDYTIEEGTNAMHRLLKNNPDMTAVFISNYEMTVGAMMEINESGLKIPDDLSVIGFDNIDFAKASAPGLSIVTQPAEQIARKAAEILLNLLENNETGSLCEKYETISIKTGFLQGRSIKELI